MWASRLLARSRRRRSSFTSTLSTFVSRHNDIGSDEVRSYLSRIPDIELRERHDEFVVRDCSVLPGGFCLKPSGLEKADNQWKVYFKSTGGVWFCHRCGSTGSWYDLKQLQNGSDISHGLRAVNSDTKSSGAPPSAVDRRRQRSKPSTLHLPDQVAVSHYAVTFAANPQGAPEVDRIRRYLMEKRGLKMEVLVKYGVGCATYRFPEGNAYVNAPCVTFPWVMTQADMKQQDQSMGTTSPEAVGDAAWITRRIKARAYQKKGWQRLDPSGGGWGLFGLHTVPEGTTEVVLTEGEYDAMAVFQATGMPAVSLPNGAGSLPIDVLPLLERFERIYLWMDNDAAGQVRRVSLSSFTELLTIRILPYNRSSGGVRKVCQEAWCEPMLHCKAEQLGPWGVRQKGTFGTRRRGVPTLLDLHMCSSPNTRLLRLSKTQMMHCLPVSTRAVVLHDDCRPVRS